MNKSRLQSSCNQKNLKKQVSIPKKPKSIHHSTPIQQRIRPCTTTISTSKSPLLIHSFKSQCKSISNHMLIPSHHFASYSFPSPSPSPSQPTQLTRPSKPTHTSFSAPFQQPPAFAPKSDRPTSLPSFRDLARVNANDESQSDLEFNDVNPKFKSMQVDPKTMLSQDWTRPQIRLEDFDQDSLSDEQFDPNDPDSYRLVIPNRYTIEDFLLVKTSRIRDRIRNQVQDDFQQANQLDDDGKPDKSSGAGPWIKKMINWRREKELAQYEAEDNEIRGVDSDLELYGGINFDQYNISVIHPNDQFKQKLLEARQVPEQYIQQQSTSWSQMVQGYKDGVNTAQDKTVTKSYLNQSVNPNNPHMNQFGAHSQKQDYLKERLNGLKTKKAKKDGKEPSLDPAAIVVPLPEISPSARKESYSYTAHTKVYSKSTLESNEIIRTQLLPPSKQPAKGIEYTPRDAYETQMFIVHRIQTDTKLRQTLRDTFKHYTKELDPISGLQACQHLLSIELYLYLQTLQDTGVKLEFENLGQQHKSFFAKLRGEEALSTAATISVSQQYRSRYLDMVLADSTGELLHLWEEEWVQLIHCVTELNPEVIRNAYIDRDTAYELLGILYGLVKRDQYIFDFEDQLNCMLIQFAKQRREQWDGNAYNNWKENRVQQLMAIEQIHEQKGNEEERFATMKERRKIEMLGDDVDNAEQLNNDRVIDELITELDMQKLKLYIGNGLLYYYRNQVYSDYGFEDDIGALLMTKALSTIPDLGIIQLQDDIMETASRVRTFELAQADDDDVEEILQDDAMVRDRATQMRLKEQEWDKENQYNENLNAARGKKKKTNKQTKTKFSQVTSLLSTFQPSPDLMNQMKDVGKRFISPDERSQSVDSQYKPQFDRHGFPIIQPPKKYLSTSQKM